MAFLGKVTFDEHVKCLGKVIYHTLLRNLGCISKSRFLWSPLFDRLECLEMKVNYMCNWASVMQILRVVVWKNEQNAHDLWSY